MATIKEIAEQIRQAGLNSDNLPPDQIPGGQADNKPDTDFDATELDRGIKHEMEHTSNPAIAKEIAKDHLSEDKEYYAKLDQMKLRGVDTKEYRLMTEAEPTTVQTIIFDKETFDATKAKEWLANNDFKNPGVDETQESMRYRQRDPGDFKENSFRTIEIAEGIKAVIGKLA